MRVNIRRVRDDLKKDIDVEKIYEDSVKWTKEKRIGDSLINLSYYIIKAQIDYDLARDLNLASGEHTDIAVKANIYIYKKDNQGEEFREGYKFFCELAGPKPKRITGVPHGMPPCTKKILQELGNETHLRSKIREFLVDLGYNPETVRRAFKRLENTERISFSCDNHSLRTCKVWVTKK